MEAYIGQIEAFAFNFAPTGWAMCAGQLLSIAQNSALFAILGTTYGGNGVQTFALPDLRGRTPIGWGAARSGTQYVIGQAAGTESVTLLPTQMPAHNHLLTGTNNSTANGSPTPGTGVGLAAGYTGGGKSGGAAVNIYSTTAPNTTLNAAAVSSSGGTQPHANLQPYTTVNYCICLQGIFPSRN